MLSILNYDGKGIDKKVDLKDLSNFFESLRNSPGLPSKPVRILKDLETQKKLIAKFSFEDGRKVALEDELHNLKELKFLDEIAGLLWSYSTRRCCVVLTEYIEPLNEKISTFGDLAKFGKDMQFREALFQILFALLNLRQKFKGFRHNDLKSDNLLVTKAEEKVYEIVLERDLDLGLTRKWKTQNVNIKFIDLELCWSECGKLKSRNLQSKDFGLNTYICEYFDIHLLMYDALTRSIMNTELHTNLREFICMFIPPKYFDIKNLTSKFRLHEEDQLLLQSQCPSNLLLEMMIHPYFHHLRESPNLKHLNIKKLII